MIVFFISDCQYKHLKSNGYCDGIANTKHCEYDGGDCCQKEACKVKKIKQCKDEKCIAKDITIVDTCTDIAGVDGTCDCIDPDVRKFFFQIPILNTSFLSCQVKNDEKRFLLNM